MLFSFVFVFKRERRTEAKTQTGERRLEDRDQQGLKRFSFTRTDEFLIAAAAPAQTRSERRLRHKHTRKGKVGGKEPHDQKRRRSIRRNLAAIASRPPRLPATDVRESVVRKLFDLLPSETPHRVRSTRV